MGAASAKMRHCEKQFSIRRVAYKKQFLTSKFKKFCCFVLVLICAILGVRADEVALNASSAQLVDRFENSHVFWQQFEIAKRIVELPETNVLSGLVSWLTNVDRHVRGNAAFIFARMGDNRGFDVIRGILDDRSERPEGQGVPGGNWSVQAQIAADRYYAVHLFGDLKDPRAVPLLLPLLRDKEVNSIVPWALGEIGETHQPVSSANQRPPVSKVTLKFISVDSQETNAENGFGKNAVDGNPNTFWHTQWHSHEPDLPHEIVFELFPSAVIKGFTYLPRQDESDHGTIKDYEFYVSDDEKHWGQPVKTGTFGPGKGEKTETFKPVKCRFIKLKAISEINGLPWTSAAEIGVIPVGENAGAKDYWRGNIGPIPSPHDPNKPDAIDSFVTAFLANGGFWLNGIDAPDVLAVSPQQVVSETLRAAHFKSGMMTSYRIVDLRKVRIGEFGTYTLALADTNLGEMIILMRSGSTPGHWWRRIYDAHLPYRRLD